MRGRSTKRVALAWSAFLLASCATVDVDPDRLEALPAAARVSLTSVVMATPDPVEDEARWIAALRTGFESEARELGIAGGPIGVEIRITQCEPGSPDWTGVGIGTGHLDATVSVDGHGELRVRHRADESFATVCRDAGRATARAIERARGDQKDRSGS